MQILTFKELLLTTNKPTQTSESTDSLCAQRHHTEIRGTKEIRAALIFSFWQKNSHSPQRLSLLQQPAPAWGWPLVALLVSLLSQHQLTFFYYFYISWISVHFNTVLSSGQCNPKPCSTGLWSLKNEMVKAVQSWKALSAPWQCCGWNLQLRSVKNNYLRNKVILHFAAQFCRQVTKKLPWIQNTGGRNAAIAEHRKRCGTQVSSAWCRWLFRTGKAGELTWPLVLRHRVLPQKLQKKNQKNKRNTKWLCRKMFVSIPSPHLVRQEVEVPQIVKTSQMQLFSPPTNYIIWWDAPLLDTHKRDTVLMHTVYGELPASEAVNSRRMQSWAGQLKWYSLARL